VRPGEAYLPIMAVGGRDFQWLRSRTSTYFMPGS
jgi:hypothetical protein